MCPNLYGSQKIVLNFVNPGQCQKSIVKSYHFDCVICTVNVTAETLVLNKDLPSKEQGFSLLLAGDVGKMEIFPALSKGFSQHEARQFLV